MAPSQSADKPRTIAFVAPSGFLPDGAVVDRAAKLFAARGWNVVAGDSVFAREQRFAGSDELRLAELQRYASDPAIDVVLSARGGYGMSRLLERLDFKAIAARAPIVVGYSDFTAFHLAYMVAGGVSFAGPSVGDFGAVEPNEYMLEQFFGVLSSSRYQMPLLLDGPEIKASGRLWGGNLAMIMTLVGTRFMPRVRGGLLFVEDVNEPAYKLERMFYQLAHAGILQKQSAIILGAFNPVTPMPNDNGFNLDTVIQRLRAIAGVPVFSGLPFGHVAKKISLPVGARARLDADGRGNARLQLQGYPHLA